MIEEKFDGKAFYNFIQEIYNGDDSFASSDSDIEHALRRTCVSRIYYSILLQIAKKYNKNPVGILDSHNYLIEKVPRDFRNNLHDMKAIRIKADYNIETVVDTYDIEDQFELYDKTITKI